MDAAAEYARRRTDRAEAVARARTVEERLAWARLAVFVAGILLAWQVFRDPGMHAAWLLLPAGVFGGLVLAHLRATRARERAALAEAWYARGIERLEGSWAGSGTSGERFADPHHPYALDLDVFGRGSVFELLCAARTRMGEDVLARWLLEPAEPAAIRERQAAVAEMADRLDLREDLAVLSADVQAGVHPDSLAAWAAAPRLLPPSLPHLLAGAATALTVAATAAWWTGLTGPAPFLLAAGIQAAIGLAFRRAVLRVDASVERPGQDLELLASVLDRFEREPFRAPLLVRLREELDASGEPPSAAVRRLSRLVAMLDSRRNQMFLPIAYVTMWGTHFATAIERWRARHGGDVPRWISAVAELEALSSLSRHAFEHPADPFPELLEGGAVFDGEGLGHPLLPEDRTVRNDVRLAAAPTTPSVADPQVLIVSGSNMSGKSTLLRTVGVNVVLGLAGAPVRARRLTLSALTLGGTLRIQDSLQEGTSRFYAEVKRLRDLVGLAEGPRPLLFLLDEILHGTNSHDRRLGAEGIVRGLVARRAIGLVTTHDLALATIAGDLAPRVANVHFEDRLVDGRMTFDYRMRPGVVATSNALELMRSVGLEV